MNSNRDNATPRASGSELNHGLSLDPGPNARPRARRRKSNREIRKEIRDVVGRYNALDGAATPKRAAHVSAFATARVLDWLQEELHRSRSNTRKIQLLSGIAGELCANAIFAAESSNPDHVTLAR